MKKIKNKLKKWKKPKCKDVETTPDRTRFVKFYNKNTWKRLQKENENKINYNVAFGNTYNKDRD